MQNPGNMKLGAYMTDKNKKPEKIFVCYSHKDKKWKKMLTDHIGILEHENRLFCWDDSKIPHGGNWFGEIKSALNEATVAILLISVDILKSDFILTEEVPRLLERRQREGLIVIPVIVRPCAWRNISWLSPMKVFPEDGTPLSSFRINKVETHLTALAEFITAAAPAGTLPAVAGGNAEPIKVSIGKMPTSGKHLFGRANELGILTLAWDKTDEKNPDIIILKAWGGVGKTALVNHWLNHMRNRGYAGAKHVYAWSFYSQGAGEGKQASADEFFNQALQWFGEPVTETLSPEEKGKRLARLVIRGKSLLILDGLEPLQYPPGELHGFDGQLKDRGMRRFLKELAAGSPGLCVITTRAPVPDVRDREGSGVKIIELEHLDESNGTLLLESLGTNGRPQDLADAVKEYGGHALALTLLGNYISRSYNGDIRKRDHIPSLGRGTKLGDHAMRVMAAYETWLGSSSVELEILRIMGLFDRPVEPGAVNALKKQPAIPGITGTIVDLPEENWNQALFNLRAAGLLSSCQPGKKSTSMNDILDCHPLVREYFSERLKADIPDGWRKAHERLYEYYKAVPQEKMPDTLEEMEPLFAAVAHGCMAGKQREALAEVYVPRIKRGDKHYSTKKLGAFGLDLSVLSNFFGRPWGQPAEELSEEDKASIFNWAATRLRALGRLHEAVQPMEAVLEMSTNNKEWKNAAIDASNLSELLLALGQVSKAVEVARKAVTYANESKDKVEVRDERTTLADALNQAGQWMEAHKLFREAEVIQKDLRPEFPLLCSLQGYQYCDLLLDQGRTTEVRERATRALEIAEKNRWLLDIALDKLSLGRCALLENAQTKSPDYTGALTRLQQAVEGLRKASYQDYIIRGLIARASCFRLQGEFEKAHDDLTEAFEIAQSGGMLLFYVDYYLESARLWKDKGDMEKAKREREEARKWMEETKYFRRKNEIEEV